MVSRSRLTGVLIMSLVLAACSTSSDSGSVANSGGCPTPPSGYEIYVENGCVPRPSDAIDVFIVYSPESQAYMPDIISQFNTLESEAKSAVTGQPRAAGERPVYVWGTDPVSGSSGTVANGIVNAIIAPNDSNVYRPTIFQPSVGHWLELANYYSNAPLFDLSAARATALSPVVVATWRSRLDALRKSLGRDDVGWEDLLGVLDSANGWCDFDVPDCRRAVYLGQADPNQSSTGLSTAIMQFYACARQNGFNERRLSERAVRDPGTQACVKRVQSLVKHYARRTEDFIPQIERGPDYLDFLGMEEGDVVCLNTGATQGDQQCRKPTGDDPLVAIYPKEGTYWHEHPFGIVNADWVTPEQTMAAMHFTDFVVTEGPQRRIMREGFRPALTSITLEYPLVVENGIDPGQPNTVLDVPEAEAIVAIQETWEQVKKSADVILLVDISGSMGNENRLDQARLGITALLERMNPRTRISLMAFSDQVSVWSEMDTFERVGGRILDQVNCTGSGACLNPTSGTALYNAVIESVQTMEQSGTDSGRIRLVLLISDGQDTCDVVHSGRCYQLGETINVIEATYADANPVIVVPVAYGSDADQRTLGSIARASRVEVVSGDPANIIQVLEQLAGYF
jgi:Ca-activated chloride channel family protein